MALLLQEENVRRLLTMEHALTAVEDAFRAQARGQAIEDRHKDSTAQRYCDYNFHVMAEGRLPPNIRNWRLAAVCAYNARSV